MYLPRLPASVVHCKFFANELDESSTTILLLFMFVRYSNVYILPEYVHIVYTYVGGEYVCEIDGTVCSTLPCGQVSFDELCSFLMILYGFSAL